MDGINGRDRAIVPDPDLSDPARAVEQQELRVALDTALQRLPEEQRSVFLLSKVEGLKQREIAEILGIAPGTVASRTYNAVRALRAELERMGHAMPRLS